jgi:adenosine deaminase
VIVKVGNPVLNSSQNDAYALLVFYGDLFFTGKMTKKQYIESIIEAIEEQDKLIATLLISVDRRRSIQEAAENVDLAIEFSKSHPGVVVGIDLSGDARIGDLKDFYPTLIKAKENGLKVSLHFAEVPNEDELNFVLDHQDFKPDRLGHSTCLHAKTGGNDALWQKFCHVKIPSEICLTSNIKCKSVSSYQEHHLKFVHQAELPFCICTDDKGVFDCSSSFEHSMAMELLELNESEMFDLSFKIIDFTFANDEQKYKLKGKFFQWKKCNL